MKRIIGSRGTGKSVELLRMALEDKNAAIVVHDYSLLDQYCIIANTLLGIPNEQIRRDGNKAYIKDVIIAPFGLFTCNPATRGFTAKTVYIDEIEPCIQKMITSFDTVAGYALSID